jgi:phenylalanyl-tRNA synthetase alpha chain
MLAKLEELLAAAEAAIKKANDAVELSAVEIKFLGRKGALTEFLRTLGSLPEADRKTAGTEANSLKIELEARLAKRRGELEKASAGLLAEREWLDVTAPGRASVSGHLHPVTQAIRAISEIFCRLGYNIVRYPEVEWDWYAFESLNMPKDHPARDEWETFFVADETGAAARRDKSYGLGVLTPHTSSGQVREMERGELPIRMIGISKCYRRQMDVTHVPMFHQFEGLLIDKGISVTHLKGTLDHFVREFFGSARRTRLRPFHFPFTEPSFEVDVSCGICGGAGQVGAERCRVCKEGWLELGGAGLVHPNVLRAGKIDPDVWSGFAFGWGIERTWAMKSGTRLDDVRILYKNDPRFLEQF